MRARGVDAGEGAEGGVVAEEGEARGLPRSKPVRCTSTTTTSLHPHHSTPLPSTPNSSQCLPSPGTSPTPTSPRQATPTPSPTTQILPSPHILRAVSTSLTARRILLNNHTPDSQGSATRNKVHLHLPAYLPFWVKGLSIIQRFHRLAIRNRYPVV